MPLVHNPSAGSGFGVSPVAPRRPGLDNPRMPFRSKLPACAPHPGAWARRPLMTGVPQLACLCLLALLSACRSFRRERGVSFATDPPGAQVFLDGEDTGFVTPCLLKVPNRSKLDVELVREGYAPARRRLVDATRRHVLYWKEMEVGYNTWRFPFWLNFEDFFIPLKVDDEPLPARIFVRMRRQADQ